MSAANLKLMLDQIERLMDGFPSPTGVDTRKRISIYITAVEDYEPHVLRQAVTNFIKRLVPSHNPAYSPTPPQLADECRRILNAQIADIQRHNQAVLQIEERERVFHEDPPLLRKMTVQRELQRLVDHNKPEATPDQVAASLAAKADYLARHDAKFVDMAPEAVRSRLLKPRI